VTVRSTTQVHFGEGDVSHRHAAAYSTLEFASSGNETYVHFGTPAQIDKVIAELVALRAEMTAGPEKPFAYRLACGCTDWCNCDRCRAGKVHDAGTGWRCDEHGRTSVADVARSEPQAVAS
jgi:hypothetical protein